MHILKRTMVIAATSLLMTTAGNAAARQYSQLEHVSPALATFTNQQLLKKVWTRDDLKPRDRSLVTIAALVANGKCSQLAEQVSTGLDNGLKPTEISEVLVQLAFYSGWSNVMPCVPAVNTVYQARDISIKADPKAEPLTLEPKAEAARKKVVNEQVRPYAQGLADDTDDVLFAQVWRRPQLAPRDRSLVTMTALIAMGQAEQLTYHLNRAMDNGLTASEAGGVVSHLAYYVGWPRAFSAVPIVRSVIEKRQGKDKK